MNVFRLFLLFAASLLIASCKPAAPIGAGTAESPYILRVGYFPNITHAQGLIGSQLTREGKGWFEARLGPGVKVEWFIYNAGPSAIEAVFADSIDITYIGPSPVLNGYQKAKGEEVRVIAGAAFGGASLVVQGDGSITKPEDFRGKRIATPQLGGTQDVGCRAWLTKAGFTVSQIGGDVSVLPAENPDQLSLFQTGHIDGAWTVEPWVSRLEIEANGKIFLEQKDALTTVLASSVKALETKREILRGFVAANAELTQWIKDHPEEAKKIVAVALKAVTRQGLPAEVLERAWPRLDFTSEISVEPFTSFANDAREAGLIKGEAVSLDKLIVKP